MTERERQMWRVVIRAPIETVWKTIVQTNQVLPFMFGATCQAESGLQAGRPMRMISSDGKSVIAYGEVLEFSPPTRFSHAINFAMAADEPPARTTYELREVADGTELTLISEAFAGTKTAKMSGSGQYIVDNIKAVVETGRPTFGGRIMLMMSPIMSLLTPARCRIEDWPLSRVPISGAQAGGSRSGIEDGGATR